MTKENPSLCAGCGHRLDECHIIHYDGICGICLKQERDNLKRERRKLLEALGLASTFAPVDVDINNPVAMMQEVAKYLKWKDEELKARGKCGVGVKCPDCNTDLVAPPEISSEMAAEIAQNVFDTLIKAGLLTITQEKNTGLPADYIDKRDECLIGSVAAQKELLDAAFLAGIMEGKKEARETEIWKRAWGSPLPGSFT